eukprot:TRINITY_DN10566_c0_g1_i1.p1 TRINITY_DN10566_c0_g1~~TRINITY_DN10566_c0_g1_i1.p1  ORF type:complete len:266 (-),score=65.54 TRINITY_DN10566_c0_g1_i1:106-903(-)
MSIQDKLINESKIKKMQLRKKTEIISPEGLRIDGRRANELRNINCKLGILSNANGSAYYEQGNTKVIASVYGPKELTKRGKMHSNTNIATITCEYTIANFGSGDRRDKKTKRDKKNIEIGIAIRKTFESVIQTNLFPRSQIDIHITVLQSDGGERCAAINATTLAIVNAGIPINDLCCSCSAGFIEGTPILDLNYLERTAKGAELPVAILPSTETVTMLQMEYKIPLNNFEQVLDLAIKGAKTIHKIMSQHILEHTKKISKFQSN